MTDGHAGRDGGAAGRAREVAALFREHGGLVERALRRSGVAECDLSDVRQEVFIVVLRKLGGFEGRSSLSTWLYAISVQVASDYRRKAHRRREQLGCERHDSCDPDALGTLERRERLEQVLRLVDALPLPQREVFVLHELFELSMAEVATRLRCPLKTAFSRLYAARRQLLAGLRARGERTPFWSALLPLREHLDSGLRAQSAASAPQAVSYALGALAAACLLLPGTPGLDAPPAGLVRASPLSVAAGGPARAVSVLPPSSAERASVPPALAAARSVRARPLPLRPRPTPVAIEAAAPWLGPVPAASAADELQLVRMGAVQVASGAEHPWAAAVAPHPRGTREVQLQGPRDPAGEIERALVELP